MKNSMKLRQKVIKSTARDVTFSSFHAMASCVIYYSTYARQNEIYLFYTSKEVKSVLKKLCFVVV